MLMKAARARKQALDMNDVDFTRLEFRFGAEVQITLRGGRVLEGSQTIPLGAAGRDRHDHGAVRQPGLDPVKPFSVEIYRKRYDHLRSPRRPIASAEIGRAHV